MNRFEQTEKPPPTILIATGNVGKVGEIRDLFRSEPVQFQSLTDFPAIMEVNETGSTFAENAELKAAGYAKQTGIWSLADDSGLEVEALGGRPGILSARYGGENLDFAAKIDLLLSELENFDMPDRKARFVCSMVLADKSGKIVCSADGECRGRIAPEPHGTGGFGFDPIFIPDGFQQTFGELSFDIKQQISHRARSAAKIIRFLRGFTVV